jgi:replication factor C large subunit
LEVIFKGQKAADAQKASYELDESPEDLIAWVDENLPLAYSGEDLWRGYESLARADVFLGRVSRRQNYGLWRYAGFLMTGGVQAARSKPRHGYVAFRPPGLWRRMGQSRKARNVRDSAARKIARRVHVSVALARTELMVFVGLLLKHKQTAVPLAAELELEEEEIALLLGSTPTTKKVQTIFEEAQKMRAAEAIEDIELAWHGTPQRQLEGKPHLVADAGLGSAETGGTAKTPPEDAPGSTKSLPDEPVQAAKPEPRKRGRPRKAEEEPKVEKKAAPETGKRQKSLFEF